MIIDDCWWLLMIADDFWCVLMIIHDFWWLLIVVDEYWWLLMIVDDCWWWLMIIGDFRWLLMIIDDCWWLLLIADDYWWSMMGKANSHAYRFASQSTAGPNFGHSAPISASLELLADWPRATWKWENHVSLKLAYTWARCLQDFWKMSQKKSKADLPFVCHASWA